MAEKIPMLALSPTMEQGLITKWLVTEGDTVTQGQVICEVETDKANMEYESPTGGTILKITVTKKATIGETIAIIGDPGEDISGIIAETPLAEGHVEAAIPPASPPPFQEQQTQTGQIRSTPLARNLARQKGIDIANISGTGPDGRIIKRDIEAIAPVPETVAMPPKPAEILKERAIPVSPKRAIIAETMSNSKFTAPHYYLTLTAIVDDLLNARQKLNTTSLQKVSLNAFLIKFTAETLKKFPMINATFNDETIIRHGRIDIALAVSQQDGLIAPVVRNCENKGIIAIDNELKILIEKTRANALNRTDYQNSTFTITNLGSSGIEQFTAIINPPNSAILAVGTIAKAGFFDDNDNMHVHKAMKLTLSCDHRIIDGAVGAQFLVALKETIEYPVSALY